MRKGKGVGRDGKTRVGKGRKGMEEGKGKGKWEGRDRAWDGEVKGKAGMGGKGGEGLQPPNINSWRRHCSHGLGCRRHSTLLQV